jgi:hypothetical protein
MVKDIILSAGIYVEAFCLTGSTLDDCGIIQQIHKNNASIGKGVVTKKSMVKHISSATDLPIFVVPDDVWKGVWVNTDKVWNKNIKFIKPTGSADPVDSCEVANFQFITNYSLGPNNE